ncbi:hypothetical protein KSP40_PGU006015 [Platanthera guangdongensis]|uniref:H15 domain-containing protein n=1 Tax=Platanthera guangdongensis TaxID=2320717 RepID=A0ABR2LPD0_9ASPA
MMITEAILALQERNGSSPQAIAKYLEEKHRAVLPSNFRKLLSRQLKNLARKGKLVRVKHSFKLSPSEKQVAKKAENVANPVSVPAKRKTAVSAKPAKKTAAGKKVKLAAPVKHKQPKSIKSPVAKRGRKTSASA